MMGTPWVVAHRGGSGYAPENTMAAFRRAVELGATFIETDLRMSRDAQLVAMHDAEVNRTTNGRGPVNQLTLAELRALDAGSWFGAEFAGEHIPTLDEVLTFAREADVVFYLELKSDATWGVEHALVAALRKAREAARTVVLSFDPAILAAVHRLDASLMTGLVVDSAARDVVSRATQVGARQLAPRSDRVTRDLVEQAHGQGLPVVTWTVNDPGRMRALIAAGVDGIMTDYPDRLREVLADRSAREG
jgi:glycerophosphoryl diester phosphodiesterase